MKFWKACFPTACVVSELAAHYGVTEETIRRDLDKLEREGYATKTYGGAILGNSTETASPTPIRNKTNVEAEIRSPSSSAPSWRTATI